MFLVNTKKCLELFDLVYVSSDSMDILKQAEKAGAIPILRSTDLCGDTPNIPVYRHAMEVMPKDIVGIVAVQANSPTVPLEVIKRVKILMEEGAKEVMTCHPNREIYGSVWGISRDCLKAYVDFYKPKAIVKVIDYSTDIHSTEDYLQALQENSII